MHKPYGPYERFFKRPLDLFCGVLAFALFWWVFAIVALLVRVKLGSPVIFKQDRPGKDERIFHLYKFRTMTDSKDTNGKLLPDSVRLTKFGKFLRSTSLDELPELFNIIKGDMSIIGPRPLMARYLPYYKQEERCRHDVRPGLTGYSQAHGRNSITWDERFRLDIEYVNKITFWGDVKIILLTIKTVLKREGIELKDLGNLDDYRTIQIK